MKEIMGESQKLNFHQQIYKIDLSTHKIPISNRICFKAASNDHFTAIFKQVLSTGVGKFQPK